ncbi:MAG: hypothetical protein H6642_18440 [Caldilineaceae bacterium]|nr:hypothetical protein [Caldilineaceae bacterium]
MHRSIVGFDDAVCLAAASSCNDGSKPDVTVSVSVADTDLIRNAPGVKFDAGFAHYRQFSFA